MNYIDAIANAIRQALPADTIVPGDSNDLFRIYAVLALVRGEHVRIEDVHNAWAAWMSGIDPKHTSLIPFAELSTDIQAEDEPYVLAIRQVAKRIQRDT